MDRLTDYLDNLGKQRILSPLCSLCVRNKVDIVLLAWEEASLFTGC